MSNVHRLHPNFEGAPRPSPEEIRKKIEDTLSWVSESFAGYYRTRGHDSLQVQNVRERGLIEDSQALANVVAIATSTELLEVQLIVGSSPVSLHLFGRGAYSTQTHSTRQAEPESVVPFNRSTVKSSYFSDDEIWHPARPIDQELYFGGSKGHVALSSLGRTLNEGGRLRLVGPDEAREIWHS